MLLGQGASVQTQTDSEDKNTEGQDFMERRYFRKLCHEMRKDSGSRKEFYCPLPEGFV